MSHFTVMVFGDDPDAALAPYCEEKREYVLVDQIGKVDGKPTPQSSVLRYIRDAMRRKEVITLIDFDQRSYISDLSEAGTDIFVAYDSSGKLCTVERSYCDGGKWDWYEIGGRWRGFFLPVPGAVAVDTTETQRSLDQHFVSLQLRKEVDLLYPGGVDRLRKGDIDYPRMRLLAQVKAEKTYDLVAKYTGPEPWKTWDEISKEILPDRSNAHEIRNAYWEQPQIKRVEARAPEYIYNVDDFAVGREQYVQNCIDGAMVPFAFIHEGRWEERGQMGWFATVSNQIDLAEWRKRFFEVFDALPDDTIVTLYDCHV